MNSHNVQVQQFLRYYFDLVVRPQYAVMIKGKWGSGKTWFVERELERLRASGRRILYLSLYGVTSIQQIEDEFFRLLHPILSSKKMMLASKVLKGFIKGTIKIDLDADGRDDGSLSLSVPDLNLPEYMRNTEGVAFVFDDIERCGIRINDLFGYINHFVEHGGYKVVLISNEDEVLEREESGKDNGTLVQYRRAKEKLIGKTFEIMPEVDDAMQSFMKDIETPMKNTIEANQAVIKSVYDASEYRNLRHLRQAVLDLSRLLSFLDTKALDNAELLAHLLRSYLIFDFEIRSGKLKVEDLAGIRTAAIRDLIKEKDKSSSVAHSLQTKYAPFSLHDSVLSDQVWEAIFRTGLIDPSSLKEAVLNSRYFEAQSQPDWVQLWHGLRLSDEDFSQLLDSVKGRFERAEYSDSRIVRHVFGMLLHYSEVGLLQDSFDGILAKGKVAVDALKNRGELFVEESSFVQSQGYGGLGYMSNERIEFKELDKYIAEKSRAAADERRPAEAKELLRLMGVDADKFMTHLIQSNDRDNRFYNIPILHLISPHDFVEGLAKLSFENCRTVTYAFRKRYEIPAFRATLDLERQWLAALIPLLDAELSARTGKASSQMFRLMTKVCRDCLLLFEDASTQLD